VEQIRRFAEEQHLEGRIQLLGKRDDAPELMRQAAVYVQPSFVEGLPLALQEAMFHGGAVVASRIKAHEELIRENQTGLLFEPGDIPGLAGALEQLMTNRSQREMFGLAAATSIRERKMTAEGMLEEHLKLYRRAKRKA
jgi:glycosyltransferase involved in cell wall biosynthesis